MSSPLSSPNPDGGKSKKLTAVPKIALRALEPQAGGVWSFSGQSEDEFALTYTMNDNTARVLYNMRSCTTEEEVRAHCGRFIYDLSNAGVNNARNSDHEIVSLINPSVPSQQSTYPIVQGDTYKNSLPTPNPGDVALEANDGTRYMVELPAHPTTIHAATSSSFLQSVQNHGPQQNNTDNGTTILREPGFEGPQMPATLGLGIQQEFSPMPDHCSTPASMNHLSDGVENDLGVLEDPLSVAMMDEAWDQFGGSAVWDGTVFKTQ